MASQQQVRQYLAYWFQLGKKVLIRGDALLPLSVIQGDRYSDEFEASWQRLIAPNAGDCYLEGTSQTIAELLSPGWEVAPCARCEMPIPLPTLGIKSLECPCTDLPSHPNMELPQPRSPVSSQTQLSQIRDRLLKE